VIRNSIGGIIIRKVFLDDLPRRNKANQIDWKGSVGSVVPFIYQDIKGEVEIVDYYTKNNRGYLDIKYKNNCSSICASSFSKCMIGVLLGKIVREYKYNVGEIIEIKSGKIQILEQIRMTTAGKAYIYKCLNDGHESHVSEVKLNKGYLCPVCINQKILIGVNDLWTTAKNTAELLKYPEKGYGLTKSSGKYEIFVCPNCNFERLYTIANVTKYGFCCQICGDGVSYPNKFVRSFLSQVDEEYIPEYLPNWGNGKKYDNYLVNKNEIWEIHGNQHYSENTFKYVGGRTLNEEQENDIFKQDLAEGNGYKYIIIDTKSSDMEYIKNSLLNLPEIKRYNLNNIDWLKCHEFACSSLVKIATDYWNNGIRSTVEIAKIMKLHSCTISEYLKKSNKLGWCDYNTKDVMKNNAKRNRKKITRSVVQLSENGEFIREWNSLISASEELNMFSANISSVCKGKTKTAGSFKWMYKEDYEQYIKDKNNNINEKKE